MIDVVATAINPDGRLVILHMRTWHPVIDQHPLMSAHMDAVMTTVMHPSLREPDLRPGRERYYRRGGPLAWLRVIAQFAGDHDRIVTAFGQTSDPTAIR